MLLGDLSQNVCLCRYHENVSLLLSACNKGGLDIPKSTSDFVKQVVCNESEECMLTNVCDACKTVKCLKLMILNC